MQRPVVTTMKQFISLLFAAAVTSLASAALPPQYQNAKDLEVMVAFVKQHPKVIASLKTIELGRTAVTFGEECVAKFSRERKAVQPGLVGPAAPLVFSSSNCPID